MISVDTSQAHKLAVDIRKAGPVAEKQLRGVVSKGALNIKKQLRREMAASRHFGQIAGLISYEITAGDASFEAEIGPQARGAGLLENIAYFGTSRGGGTVPDPKHALAAEAPNVEKYLSKLAAGLL